MCVSAWMAFSSSSGIAIPPPPAFAGAAFRVLGKSEIDPAVARVEPTAGHHFASREEVHTVGTVCMGVPEERAVPPSKGVIRDGHRDRDVDPDHADLDLVLEPARRATVVGEDRRAV